MPRFHNPLGSSLAERDKRELVRLAAAYDVYLVEDDYLGDLEENKKADPLYAYDLSSHVIYLKSFSKMIFPGLRVGAAVLPDALTDTFHTYKKLKLLDDFSSRVRNLHQKRNVRQAQGENQKFL